MREIIRTDKLRKERCSNCQHFAPSEGRDLPTPTCRKNLPSNLITPNGGVAGFWTPTKAEYFCGQWEKAKPDLYEADA